MKDYLNIKDIITCAEYENRATEMVEMRRAPYDKVSKEVIIRKLKEHNLLTKEIEDIIKKA